MAARYTNHVKIFLRHNPEPPWICRECDEPILALGRESRDGVIHHLNKKPRDNRIENLVVLHHDCHSRLHGIGRKHTNETKAKMSAAALGHEVSAEVRSKISAANTGNKYCVGREYSVETREKLRNMGSPSTCECGLSTSRASMVSHLRATSHQVVS